MTNTTPSVALSNKAMLASLSISQWTARKYDRKATKKVEEDYHAKEAGRFNKILISLDEIKAIQKIVNEARGLHYDYTLPWGDKGTGILPTGMYMEYMSKMRAVKDKYTIAVQKFIDIYPSLKEEAKRRLNGLYRDEDYPSPAELERKYAFHINIMPLPDAKDFRVSLQAEEVERIRRDIEVQIMKSQNIAMQNLWQRLYARVKRMAERLSDDEAVFRDSLVHNLIELCRILPAMNIAGDPKLEEMRRDVERKLCIYSPQELRDNKHNRREIARNAQSILKTMAGYVGDGYDSERQNQ
jgi:hypothetical protein